MEGPRELAVDVAKPNLLPDAADGFSFCFAISLVCSAFNACISNWSLSMEVVNFERNDNEKW